LILQGKVYYKGKRVDKIEKLVEMDNNLDFLLQLQAKKGDPPFCLWVN